MDRRRSSRIVPEIYEATINPVHWDYVVAMIAKLTGSRAACIYYKNNNLEFANTVASYGFSNETEDLAPEFVDRLADFFDVDQATNTPSVPSGTISFYPEDNDERFHESEFYQTWMQPLELDSVAGASVIDCETHKAGVAVFRGKPSKLWDQGDSRVLDEILPHLERALNIYSEFTHLKLKQDALLKGLDRLVIGLVLYDRNANPIYINPTARSIIESHPGLGFSGDNFVVANADESECLKKAIIDTAMIDPDDSWKQSIAIGINHPTTKIPLPLLVTPMHAHMITSDLDFEGAKVAVFMSDPDTEQPISRDSLVSVYGLTPSEAQVAISLANGHSIDQIATSTNHSSHTIRAQLKSVFRKVGVSRQSELMKLLLTGPFAQRRRSSESRLSS